jgi:uncharacterized protein YndB with AHSA1/START domain
MVESIELSIELPVKPEIVFNAWMDSQEHGEFTCGKAEIDPQVGGSFTAWDDYIQGTTLELEPYHRIIQSWRTTDFPPESPDSNLVVTLDEIPEGTHLTLTHTNIPDGQGAGYEQGWQDYYFTPMYEYFTVHETQC